MPVVNCQVLGTLSDEQKRELSRRFTEALQQVAGKPPEYTYVIFQEVPRENWAHAGVLFADRAKPSS